MERKDRYHIAILGATGAVGRRMLSTLERRGVPVGEVRLLASPRSAGTRVSFRGEELVVEAVRPESFDGVDIALFSAGASASEEWAPVAVERGAVVIDNSSAFRMHDDVPLVVPKSTRTPSRTIAASSRIRTAPPFNWWWCFTRCASLASST